MIDWTLLLILIEVIIIITVGFYIGKTIHWIIVKLFKLIAKNTNTLLDDYIIQYTENPIKLFFIVASAYLLSGIIENLSFIQETLQQYYLSTIVLLLAYTLSEAIGGILRWYYDRGKKKSNHEMDITLLPFIRKISKIIIITAGITIALAIIGIDVTGILALTSVVALILGLASQETLANIFAGLALQLDRPCNYGDYIRLTNGDLLKLVKIGTRSTKLVDLEGNRVVLSNSEFAKQRVTQWSKQNEKLESSITVPFPPQTKIETVQKKIEQSLSKKPINGLEKELKFYIDRIEKDHILILIEYRIQDLSFFRTVRSELNNRILSLKMN